MQTTINITLPAVKEELAPLNPGDRVCLFGSIYTMRDAGHQRALEFLRQSGTLPYDLEGQALFYAGPTPPRAGRPVGAIGPTTASRMDAATPALLAAGITLTLGKGSRSGEVARACAATGSVYLVAVGGAAAYLGGFVAQSRLIAWEDLGTEALRCLTLTGLPAYVGIDSRGKTLDHFSTAQQASILPDRLGTPSQASTPAAHFSPTAAHGTSHSITPERRIT